MSNSSPTPISKAEHTGFGKTYHAYRGRKTLCLQCVTSRIDVHTLNLSIGLKEQGDAFAKSIILQISELELPHVMKLLLGDIRELNCLYHGVTRKKSYHLRWNGEDTILTLRLQDGDTSRAIAMLDFDLSVTDVFWASQMLLSQMLKNAPGLTGVDIMQLLARLPHSSASPYATTEG